MLLRISLLSVKTRTRPVPCGPAGSLAKLDFEGTCFYPQESGKYNSEF